jgi:hypothetical protein
MSSGIAMIIALVIGFILIIAGAIKKPELVLANVIGVPTPIPFKGKRQELDLLLQIIRQKQTSQFADRKEAKDIGIAKTRGKLAEAQNTRIITKEEFIEREKEEPEDKQIIGVGDAQGTAERFILAKYSDAKVNFKKAEFKIIGAESVYEVEGCFLTDRESPSSGTEKLFKIQIHAYNAKIIGYEM